MYSLMYIECRLLCESFRTYFTLKRPDFAIKRKKIIVNYYYYYLVRSKLIGKLFTVRQCGSECECRGTVYGKMPLDIAGTEMACAYSNNLQITCLSKPRTLKGNEKKRKKKSRESKTDRSDTYADFLLILHKKHRLIYFKN